MSGYDPKAAATLYVTEPGNLFDVPPPRSKANALPTSAKAADQIASRVPSIGMRALQAIAGTSGLTADEAADRIGEDHLAVRPRVSQMYRERGWLEPTGVERPSSHGGEQAVMRVTEAGKRELERCGLDSLSVLLRAGKP